MRRHKVPDHHARADYSRDHGGRLGGGYAEPRDTGYRESGGYRGTCLIPTYWMLSVVAFLYVAQIHLIYER